MRQFLLVLFTLSLTAVIGFAGGVFWGAVGVAILMAIGLSISFVIIAAAIGR
ncbi:hypothetical protein [uncultured Rhodoblastus sp.]|uniref:hypothetical protein n=1 Tax=uncultured Rhodoblastus sp. TaxID=543037 RepID=UPI0025DE8D78|nr:hypothetical protein [uncultured Rhodoblastus sp.]